jgi:TolA-binding protein
MKNRRLVLIFLFAFYVLALFGCYGTYDAERDFWLANRKYERLIKKVNAAATAEDRQEVISQEAGDVIIALRNVTLSYPSWPFTSQAMLLIANVYVLEGRLDKAIMEYEEIIKEFPHMQEQSASAILALASIYKDEGDWDKARQLYQQVINEYLETQSGIMAPLQVARYYKSRAMNQEAEAAYGQAINTYKTVIREKYDEPYSAAALEQLMNVYSDLGKWEEALEYLHKIANEYPDSPLALQAMLITGTIYEVQLNDRDKAFEIYSEMVEKYPQSPIVERIRERLKLYGK